jgi:hypothetical protein
MITLFVLGFLLLVSIAANVFCVIALLRFTKKITSIELAVENALVEFDRSYNFIWKLLQTPLVTDDPVVRSVHRQMKNVLASIHGVAEKLAIEFDALESEKDGNNGQQ